jgi:hypothetical protein
MRAATPQAFWRARLLAGAGLLFLAAGIITFYTVPQSFGPPPVGDVLFGALLVGASLRARPHERTGRVIAGFAGFVALWGSVNTFYMGVLLSHRPDLPGVAVLMPFAAACQLAAMALAFSASGLFQRGALALRQVWHAARSQPWVAALVLTCWLSLLGLAAYAWFWQRSAWNPIFDLCVIMPIPISLLIGYRMASAAGPEEQRFVDGLVAGGLVGLIVLELNQVLFVAWDVISYLSQPTLPPLGERHDWPLFLAAAYDWLYGYGIRGVAQGALAGLVGAALVVLWQRWQSRRGPVPSASVP